MYRSNEREHRPARGAGRSRRHPRRTGIVLLAVLGLGFWLGPKLLAPPDNTSSPAAHRAASSSQGLLEGASLEAASLSSLKDARVSGLSVSQTLRLVNGDNPLPPSDDTRPVSAYRRVALSRSNIELGETALLAVIDLFSAAKEAGFDDLVVTSGYRTYARQQEIYDEAADKAYVQKPGASEHQTGLAVDIQLFAGGMERLGETEQGIWLAENAYKYGFVLRYPEGREDITGIAYESWHFRFVGQPHATVMTRYGFCLEEYVDWLSTHESYVETVNGVTYQVYRQVPKDGIIKLPSEGNYTVSEDNTGGYIITSILD